MDLENLIKSAVMEAVSVALKDSGPIASPRLFTLAQAAEYLGCAEWTVRGLMERGELPRVRLAEEKSGGRLYFDRVDLDKLIAERKEGGRAA